VLTSREDEAAMRVVLLVLAITNVILAFAAVGLFEWWRAPQFIGDTNVYLGQLAAALGFLVALATAIVGSMAMAQRRQMGWLGGLIVAWLISAVGSHVAIVVIQPWQYYVVWDRCPPQMNCELPPPSWLPWPFLAAPPLVGLVVLLYRFNMRAPGAATWMTPS
jgi:hypothetical protein